MADDDRAEFRSQMKALLAKGYSLEYLEKGLAERAARETKNAEAPGRRLALQYQAEQAGKRAREIEGEGPSLGREVAAGVGTVMGDALDTLSFGGYRKARDYIGDKLAPESMAAARRAEDEIGNAETGDLPLVGKLPVGQYARNAVRSAAGFSPVGAPGMAMRAAENVTRGMRPILQAALGGGIQGGVTNLGDQAVRGDGLDVGELGAAAGLGAVVGGAVHGAGATGGAIANKIRGSKGKIGEDIRLLEGAGASPSPVPFRPVKNAPSKRLGVDASSEGRGEIAERGARRLTEEVDAQDRALGGRIDREMGSATKRQGDRVVSVESLISRIDEQLATPEVDLRAGLRSKLETTKRVLEGEIEPTIEVFTPAEVDYHNSPRAAVGPKEWDADYGVRRRLPVEREPGPQVEGRIYVRGNETDLTAPQGPQREVYESLEKAPQRTTEEAYTVHSGGGEPIRVGTGDVRRRVGDGEPNRVMTTAKLNQLRDVLDEAAGVESLETGIAKNKLPLYSLANEIRHGIIKREAPAMGLANRRYSTGKAKIEATRERMKSDDPESLGMQIASLGEEGSKTAGVRKVRLGELREQFPTSEQLTERQVGEIFDNPRLLLAEERLKLKRLPRIGGGGDDMLNLAEPLLARGVYPSAREAEMALALGDTANGRGGAAQHAPRVMAALRAREQEKERARKLRKYRHGTE